MIKRKYQSWELLQSLLQDLICLNCIHQYCRPIRNLCSGHSISLLRTIQLISIADFIERLDVLFLMAIFIGAFFKLLVYVYVALIASTDLFKLKSYKKLIYPFGIIILFMSMTIASNISEQIQEGLKVIPLYLQFPFQVIIPILLLCIGLWKNRNKLRKQRENQQNQNEENNNHSETSEQKENYVGYNLEN